MKYAVITGATQGIGKTVAEKLLSEGFSVAICSRSANDLKELRQAWQQMYPNATIIAEKADFEKKEEVVAFAGHVLRVFPAIDILVNNAGVYFPGNIADEKEGQLESLMAVNMFSAYHLTRRLLPKMKEQGRGHIFNMCSVASLKSYPNGGSYSISKYALLGFSENLRYELKDSGIKVTAICPGATNSRSWEGSSIPSERIMESEDVSEMIWASYILSSKADVEMIVMRPMLGDL